MMLIQFMIKLLVLNGVWCLRKVSITAPRAVISGNSATLRCEYDYNFPEEDLKSISWYRNNQKVFSLTPEGINCGTCRVPFDLMETSEYDFKIVGLRTYHSGEYKCRIVSTKQTAELSTNFTVVEPPVQPPRLGITYGNYTATDIIQANCSVEKSYPTPNITWMINDDKIGETLTKYVDAKDYLEDSKSTLSVLLLTVPSNSAVGHNDDKINLKYPEDSETAEFLRHTLSHNGDFVLSCAATIFNVYEQRSESVFITVGATTIVADRPFVLRSKGSGIFDNFKVILTVICAFVIDLSYMVVSSATSI